MAQFDVSEILTAAKLNAICQAADPDIVEAILTEAPTEFPKAGLDTVVKVAHFLGQIAAETGGLRRLDENLNYSSAKRLIAVFGSKRFPSEDFAKGFVMSPKKLANYVYAKRNGNKNPDDGWTYRGSGLIQLTGRGNFATVGALVGMPLEAQPEMCREPDSALKIALGYWRAKKISDVATDATDNALEAVTKRINPALIGLPDRRLYFKRALKILAPAKAVEIVETERAALQELLFGGAREGAMASIGEGAAPVTPSLSGAHWTEFFQTSRSIDDLAQPFREQVADFVGMLRAAGANVRISATFRPKERAYLMHYAWLIAKQKIDPGAVPPMQGVPIQWRHPTAAASVSAAREMVAAYSIAVRPALESRHTQALAIDMTISWGGALSIQQRDGARVVIDGAPRNGSNSRLIAVAMSYGVIKLVSDPPHWSNDGH
jgi:predicted chitinase